MNMIMKILNFQNGISYLLSRMGVLIVFNNLFNMIGEFGVAKSGLIFGFFAKMLYDLIKYARSKNSAKK